MKVVTGFVIFQHPIVAELFRHVESDGPVVPHAVDFGLHAAALRVALHACVARLERLHARWIDDIRLRRARGLL